MTFATPWVLWLAGLAAAAVAGLVAYDRARRRQLTRRLGELPVIGRVMASASPGRRTLKAVLAGAALVLIVIAAARPRRPGRRRVELRGLDLVVAVDVSKSMLVEDVGPTPDMAARHVHPTRLGRARELAAALVDELPGDRIAPVVFAGAASHFPLTEDHEVAVRFLEELGPVDLPPGSNLAEVFRVGRCLLRPDLYDDLGCASVGRRGHGGDPLPGESLDPVGPRREEDPLEVKAERGKAIIVLTDGADADSATAREVATARELGIAVVLVGIGSTRGGLVHELDLEGHPTAEPERDRSGDTILSRREDAAMKALAAAAGDPRRYLIARADGDVDPAPLARTLRAVGRGLATRRVRELHDVYQPFLFAAFMLLVIEVAISTRRRRPRGETP